MLTQEFLYLMGNVQSKYRSRSFISKMTFVMRALQFSMNLGLDTPPTNAGLNQKEPAVTNSPLQ